MRACERPYHANGWTKAKRTSVSMRERLGVDFWLRSKVERSDVTQRHISQQKIYDLAKHISVTQMNYWHGVMRVSEWLSDGSLQYVSCMRITWSHRLYILFPLVMSYPSVWYGTDWRWSPYHWVSTLQYMERSYKRLSVTDISWSIPEVPSVAEGFLSVFAQCAKVLKAFPLSIASVRYSTAMVFGKQKEGKEYEEAKPRRETCLGFLVVPIRQSTAYV